MKPPSFGTEIANNGAVSLYANYDGINDDNTFTRDKMTLAISMIDNNSMRAISKFDLKFNEIKSLYSYLSSVSIINKEERYETNRFIELDDDIKETLKRLSFKEEDILKAAILRIREFPKLEAAISTLNDNEVQNLHAAIRQTRHKNALTNLSILLELEENGVLLDEIKKMPDLAEYVAGQPEKVFQNWIEQNLWALGVDYIGKHDSRKIGISSESDLIMQTIDGYIDIIELKRPKAVILKHDDSHNCYFPNKELSMVLGQSMHYLKIVDTYKLVLEKENDYQILRPRIRVIIGRSSKFTKFENDALRMLNSSLNHISIMSYDHLFESAHKLVSYYDEVIDIRNRNNAEASMPTIS